MRIAAVGERPAVPAYVPGVQVQAPIEEAAPVLPPLVWLSIALSWTH